MCRFMLHTTGVLLAYAYQHQQNWGMKLDDLILGLYKESGRLSESSFVSV